MEAKGENQGVMRRRSRGFSIIELVLVIGFIGVVIGAIVPMLNSVYQSYSKMTTKRKLTEVRNEIEAYRMQVGRLPRTLYDLMEKPSDEKIARKWAGPYIDDETKFNDAWGEEFVYQPTKDDEGNSFTLFSWGPEGEGSDEASQISAWK